ncbi:MAG: D-alanyl-D-alanine carboxypeptidase [Geodermatophilaceae bacterium]|nr:D-alanyl-D-alanine carboxypeptidase [Geodermatophilaceae bacterium]
MVAFLGWPGIVWADSPRPTANPAGASPTVPDPVGPPVGSAPDGDTVGGKDLASRGLVLPPDAPPLPADITARGWVVADASSGVILAAKDAHGRYYPASTLKLLTLLSLYPRLDPAQVVTATVQDEQIEGSRVGLINGGQYDVATLWLALMLQSGNDAANALSRTAGGLEPTLEAMYRTADRLQAYDTSPGGPSGLDVEGQRSSAYDLTLMMTAAVADPQLLAVMATASAQIPAVPGMDEGFEIQNQNQLLLNYPGTLAGKTGFTDAARYTFVGAAERDGRQLVVSLMLAEQVPIPTWEQAARLLDWGFALPAGTPSVGDLVAPLPAGAPSPTGPETSPALPGAPVSARTEPGADDLALLPLLALATGSIGIALGTFVWSRRPPVSRRTPGGSGANRAPVRQRPRDPIS